MTQFGMNTTVSNTPNFSEAFQKQVKSQIPSFDRLMQSHGRSQEVKAGTTIFLEGDPSDALFYVASGVVRCCQITADGRRQISRFVTAGGQMGLTAFEVYGYTAEAVSDITLIRCTRSAFNGAMREDTELRDEVFELMASTLKATRDQMVLLGQLSATERAAAFLLEMTERIKDRDEEIHLSMTRQDIADYLGMTLETVSRMFNKFKKQGVISMATPDRIRVCDLDKLEMMSAAA